VHVHFVLAGCLFMWHVVGLDPIPHALGYGARLLFVLVALPFHAFLGAALLGSERVLGGGWYDEVVRDWGTSPLADQRTGAGILWLTGELLGVVLVLLVLRQWMRADAREAARHDRQLDAAETA
jgi:putative membrane protein